ncbi:MAG: hypothetical protein RLZZ323_1241, partial [Bacteroidota bacterium]
LFLLIELSDLFEKVVTKVAFLEYLFSSYYKIKMKFYLWKIKKVK